MHLGLLLAMTTMACSKPEPPTIVPKEAKVTAVSPAGLDILVRVEATNPNSVTLSAQSFTGKAEVDGKYELATVVVNKAVSLPPKTPTMIDVPLNMPWADVNTLIAMSQAQRPIPYTVYGTVAVGGESINVNIPFSMSGTITRDQLVGAALKGIPSIPGLTLPNVPSHP
jgi:LEA14-like dessication related protein